MARGARSEKSPARALGEFVGHIRAGIKAKPDAASPRRREVSRTVDEETRDTSRGRVTLRRTVIDEVELPPDESRSG